MWLGLVASAAWSQTCAIEAGEAAADRLLCTSDSAWRVRCSVPHDLPGKVRVRLEVPGRQIDAEAPVPTSHGGELDFAIAKAGGSGDFHMRRGAPGLLPGQVVGRMQLCPVVQPGVAPGAAPVEFPLRVRVTAHQTTGFADGEGGGRVPVYDKGRVVAATEATLVQRPVRDAPIFAGTLPALREEEVAGTLNMNHEGAWHAVSWAGLRSELAVATGHVALLRLDFPAAALRRATGERSSTRFLERDLLTWMEGGYDSLLGIAAWRRSGLAVPVPGLPAFEDVRMGGQSWRRARTGTLELRVARQGDRVRVVIAHRATNLDDAARAAIDAHAGE